MDGDNTGNALVEHEYRASTSISGDSAQNALQVVHWRHAAPEQVPVPDHTVFPGRDAPMELGMHQNVKGNGRNRDSDMLGERGH